MHKNRLVMALSLMGILFAGALHADKVAYFEHSGGKVEVKQADNATIESWNASSVTFKVAKANSMTVDYDDIISLDRHYGTMGNELSSALDLVGKDPDGALKALAAIATSSSNKLDREEAALQRAQLLDDASANNRALIPNAIKAYGEYIGSYSSGYFAREAYSRLAALQESSKQVTAARNTLKSMIRADKSMQLKGNQLLGEFEGRQGKWADAISAFQAAQSAARSSHEQDAEYLAKSWEGWMTLKAGKTADAKKLLEAVTTDKNFDDPRSTTDELALSIAYPALGDAHFADGNYQKAYDAYIKGAYYAWWVGGNLEGHCLGNAFLSAKKLEGTGDKWKKRKDKLHTALALGFPRELQRVDKD